MATSMCAQNLQLLVENRFPRARTASSQMCSRALLILPSGNLVLGQTQKVRLRTSSDTTVSAAYGHRWNWTAKTGGSHFMPSFGGAQRGNVVRNVGGQSSRETRTDDIEDATVTAAVPPGAVTGDQTWLRTIIPENLWPYAQLARIEKPIGTWLLIWPTYWSLCLAAPAGTLLIPQLLALFAVWSVLMRGAACTVNDIFDRDIDAQVERTQSRPFPSGAVNLVQGVTFLGLQVMLGIALLAPLNVTSQIYGAAFAPVSCIYPLMKRVTYWPQAYLGFFFNWGAVLGWAAVHGNVGLTSILPLYGSGILWTLVYDTIYAHQDKIDDRRIGVKSTALLFAENTKNILTLFGTGSVLLLAWTGLNFGLGWSFYAGVAAAAAHLAWQIYTVNLDDPEDCGAKFRSNQSYGAVVFGAILLGKLAAVHP